MKEYEVGKTRRNRLGACTELKRRMSKLCGVSNWFRVEKDSEEKSPKSSRGGRREDQAKLGPERPLEAMMFVPCTEGASLKKFLQEEGKLIGYGKVKYVESSGRTIADMLVRKILGKETAAGKKCFTCTSGNTGQCMQQGSTYRIDCGWCKGEDKQATYFGE